MMKTNLKATVNGNEYVWTVEIQASALVVEATRKGFQEWLQDAASTAKPTDEEAAQPDYALDNKDQRYKDFMAPIRVRAVKERLGKIQSGTYKPGAGGGGGKRQSPEDKGWLEYFRSIGYREGGHPVNGKTLRRAQEAIVREELLAEFDAGTDERRAVEANLQKHLEDRFDEIVGLIESDAEDPIGALIALERAKVSIQTGSRGSRLRGK